jgi:transposase-like protein
VPRDGPGPVCLLEVLAALKVADVGDRLRQAAETIYQALIEAELTAVIGAAPHERSAERTAQHRTRVSTTTAGDLELRIPKLRTGSFFPSLLERRRRVDQALFAVVMEAYLHGCPPARSTTWSKPWARTPASASPKSRASAPIWTPRSARSATAAWLSRPSRTCSWTPPTARPG